MNRRNFLITAIGAPLAAKLLPEPVLAKAGDALAAKVPGIVTQHYKGIRGLPNARGEMWKLQAITGLQIPYTTARPLTCCDVTNLKNVIRERAHYNQDVVHIGLAGIDTELVR